MTDATATVEIPASTSVPTATALHGVQPGVVPRLKHGAWSKHAYYDGTCRVTGGSKLADLHLKTIEYMQRYQ